jgi:hypothetical protein
MILELRSAGGGDILRLNMTAGTDDMVLSYTLSRSYKNIPTVAASCSLESAGAARCGVLDTSSLRSLAVLNEVDLSQESEIGPTGPDVDVSDSTRAVEAAAVS